METAGRVLFVRLGQMIFYAGPQQGDERPRAGGKHNVKNLGHEVFNFYRGFGERLYGTFGIVGRNGAPIRINLQRIDPEGSKSAERLNGVLVIFIAPYNGERRVVGWYGDATVYRTHKPYPVNVNEGIQRHLRAYGIENDTFNDYWFEGKRSTAVLLPSDIRMKMRRIPQGQGGIGQSNLCYVHEPNGAPKSSPWIWQILETIGNYHGENLLTEPEVESSGEIEDAQERASGHQSNPEIRRLVEEHAMQLAERELRVKGFDTFDRTSDRECFDYTCTLGGLSYYVEVKGTQTPGSSVILTKNEVEHARQHPNTSILVVVHSIKVRPNGSSFDVTEGTLRVLNPWILDDVQPTHFKWRIPETRT